jgi:amphi-Trp domain-containing protein
MSDVEISRTEAVTRHQAANRLAALAAALRDDGSVEVELGASTLKLHVPDHLSCEVEVEVDGDEVELEVELKWSIAASPIASMPAQPAVVGAADQAAKPRRPVAKPARARARP